MLYIILILVSYLLGSIPFGYLLTKFSGLGDIRNIGSGSIGATNVLRTGNKKLALFTMLLDAFKGVVAVLIALWLQPDFASYAGLIALLGHIFPVWLKFKGGKGVATAEGILLALYWPAGIITAVIWVSALKLTRTSSLGALVAVSLSTVWVYILGREDLGWFTLTAMLLIFWTHRANIRRLINGTEPKVGSSKNAAPSAQ